MTQRFETFTVLINRISRNIRKIKNQEMAAYNLRSAHVSCLYYMYIQEGITATELCEKCEEDKATVSRALDYLEQTGFVAGTKAKRYKSPLMLTEKGALVGKQIADKIDAVLEEVSVVLSEEERYAFYHSLAIISESIDAVANSKG